MRLFRYDDFLKEGKEKEHLSVYKGKGRSQSLDHLFTVNDIEELLNKYAPYFLEKENIDTTIGESNFIRLYRGIKVKGDVYLTKPSVHHRVSRNTENYYTNIIDGTWEGYPKRGKSLICSTSKYRARRYGKSFRVIPLDKSALLGICPGGDIWLSFDQAIDKINNAFSGLFKYTESFSGGIKNNLDYFNNFLREAFGLEEVESLDSLKVKLTIDNFIENNPDIKSDEEAVEQLKSISKDGNLYHLFEEAFSPELNDFKSIEFSSTNRKDYSLEREVWTEADCLMIEADAFDYWIEKKYKMPTVDKFGWAIKDGMSTDPRLKTDEERRQRVEDSK